MKKTKLLALGLSATLLMSGCNIQLSEKDPDISDEDFSNEASTLASVDPEELGDPDDNDDPQNNDDPDDNNQPKITGKKRMENSIPLLNLKTNNYTSINIGNYKIKMQFTLIL